MIKKKRFPQINPSGVILKFFASLRILNLSIHPFGNLFVDNIVLTFF